MSTDLIKSIQDQLALLPTGVDDDTKAVAGSGGNNKRISIKGGAFRKIAGGKEIGVIEERHLDVIFVKMAHDPARNYYAQGYTEGAKVAPVCWSSNSKNPDPEVKVPVAASCSACPNSVSGSGTNGVGTACRLSWRTAIVIPKDPGGDVMQLVLPATSVFGKEVDGKWPFRSYIQMLASHNISAGRVITRAQFDIKSPQPKLLFQPVGAVPQEDVAAIQEQSKSTAAENAIKMVIFQPREESAVAPAAAVAPPPAPPEGEAVPEPTLRKNDKPATTTATPEVADIIKKWAKK
jgi:hypothetical protein